MQARRRRRTLLVSSSSDVYVELDGDSYNTTDSIKADLTNAVNNGGLAVRILPCIIALACHRATKAISHSQK